MRGRMCRWPPFDGLRANGRVCNGYAYLPVPFVLSPSKYERVAPRKSGR